MSQNKSLEDLDVWQKGKVLTLKIYEISSHFPQRRDFRNFSASEKGRLYQYLPTLRRVSGDFIIWTKPSSISMQDGSLYELKSHLLIAGELGFIKDGAADDSFDLIEQFL